MRQAFLFLLGLILVMGCQAPDELVDSVEVSTHSRETQASQVATTANENSGSLSTSRFGPVAITTEEIDGRTHRSGMPGAGGTVNWERGVVYIFGEVYYEFDPDNFDFEKCLDGSNVGQPCGCEELFAGGAIIGTCGIEEDPNGGQTQGCLLCLSDGRCEDGCAE